MYDYKKMSKVCQNISVLFVKDDATGLKENKIIFQNFFTTIVTAEDGVHFDIILNGESNETTN